MRNIANQWEAPRPELESARTTATAATTELVAAQRQLEAVEQEKARLMDRVAAIPPFNTWPVPPLPRWLIRGMVAALAVDQSSESAVTQSLQSLQEVYPAVNNGMKCDEQDIYYMLYKC